MSAVHDEYLSAFATMSEAIHQAHEGHAHWFSIYMDNLVYRPLFGGKSAKQLRAFYGIPRRASFCALLPEEARQAMIRRMTFITEQLQSGKEYTQIKELVLSILPTEPLVFDRVPEGSTKAGPSRHRRLHHGSSIPLPGQLSLLGLGANEDEGVTRFLSVHSL